MEPRWGGGGVLRTLPAQQCYAVAKLLDLSHWTRQPTSGNNAVLYRIFFFCLPCN